MWIPIALFVTLLAVTAVIAHVSDNLGKKLGKKRVSVLGLRPRHTATLLTVGSSWAIMIVTLGVLLLAVAPIRNALFFYESERARFADQTLEFNNKLLKAQRTTKGLEEKATLLGQKAGGLQGKVVKFQSSALKSQALAQKYQGQAQDFQDKAQDAQSDLRSARRNEQSAKRGAQTALATAKSAQANARRSLNAANTARAQELAAQEVLTNTRLSLKVNEARLTRSQQNLKKAQNRFANYQKVANKKVVASYKQVVESYKQVVQAQKEVTKAKAEVTRYQEQIKTLQIQADDLKNQTLFLNQYSAQFEFNDISLPFRQILAERRFDATRSPDDISRELRIIVDAARTAAQKILNNEKLDFVVGARLPDKSGGVIDLNEAEAIEFYAKALSSANQTVSGRLVSASNYPSNTTGVVAQFVFVPIRTIYSARQNIAEATIDTNKSESAIFRQLQDLVDAARRKAEADGARPPLVPDPEAPNFFFDGDTGQKMFAALHQIQAVGHPVRVRIVAARDLDSAESLQIRFLVGDQEQ